jgi:hypothetical protein
MTDLNHNALIQHKYLNYTQVQRDVNTEISRQVQQIAARLRGDQHAKKVEDCSITVDFKK